MIVNKDKKTKNLFVATLKRLKLQETPNETMIWVNPNGQTVILNNMNYGSTIQIADQEYNTIGVDDDGKVFLSDRDIDRIAKRVIDLLKKERLM